MGHIGGVWPELTMSTRQKDKAAIEKCSVNGCSVMLMTNSKYRYGYHNDPLRYEHHDECTCSNFEFDFLWTRI